jgi:hypothetical protein
MALLAIKADETQLGPCPSLSFNGADFDHGLLRTSACPATLPLEGVPTDAH